MQKAIRNYYSLHDSKGLTLFDLELHEVRAILVAECEARLEVLGHDGVLDLDGGVDGLLSLLLDLGAVFFLMKTREINEIIYKHKMYDVKRVLSLDRIRKTKIASDANYPKRTTQAEA